MIKLRRFYCISTYKNIMIQPKTFKKLSVRNPRTGGIDYHFNTLSLSELVQRVRSLRQHQVNWQECLLIHRIEALRQWNGEDELISDTPVVQSWWQWVRGFQAVSDTINEMAKAHESLANRLIESSS